MGDQPRIRRGRLSSGRRARDFGYLDRDDFRAAYASPDNPRRMRFHVDGVYCTACLWKIESVADELDGVERMRLDMSRHIVDVEINERGSMEEVAQRLNALGYTPRPVSFRDDDTGRTNKSMLTRLGIAAASAGNIMLLSTSLYSGAQESEYRLAFEWLTFVLFLPILLYSAVPFYRAALAALRNRSSSIDVPIAAALVVGTGLGLYHLIVRRGDIYFDSLAVLVFLLLGSRYLLFSLQRRFLAPTHLSAFYESNRVRVKDRDTGRIEEKHIDGIGWGDEVVLYRGERLPVDGRLATGEAWINAAVLTGEPYPQRVVAGQSVFAGTQLDCDSAVIVTERTGRSTRIGQLLDETERGVLGRTPLVSLTDRVGQWFSAAVLVLAATFALLYATVDVHEAINRGLALVILACPCALALATPLTQSLALKKAAKGGALIKNAEAFETLAAVRDVFFDKTGTLTRGEIEIEGWYPERPTPHEAGVIVALETGSQHPVGRALAAAMGGYADGTTALTGCREIPGVGVSGSVGGTHWELRAPRGVADAEALGLDSGAAGTVTVLYRDGSPVRAAQLHDAVRESSKRIIAALETHGRTPWLLTGDAVAPALTVAGVVGIPAERVIAAASPEEKLDVVRRHPRALMVGDGVNDSVALAHAYVGVAVEGSMETSFQAADIYLTRPGLQPLADLFDLSRTTLSIIKRNLLFSLIYNTIGAALALMGLITPLVAAVLMPVSSVTVILSSVIGNRFWRRYARTTVAGSPAAVAIARPAPPLAAGGGGA